MIHHLRKEFLNIPLACRLAMDRPKVREHGKEVFASTRSTVKARAEDVSNARDPVQAKRSTGPTRRNGFLPDHAGS